MTSLSIRAICHECNKPFDMSNYNLVHKDTWECPCGYPNHISQVIIIDKGV